jgi:pyrimidine operon attenuation protein/uracil phosphoribosyltransferase
MSQNIILNNEQINHKLRRIAYQIYENNAHEKELILAGITGNGYYLTQKLSKQLKKISDLDIQTCEVNINKKDVFQSVTTSLSEEKYKNKSLVLVDDVLHTGTTLMYAIKHFLNVPLKQFHTAVLIDRNHKKYPVKADFKGLSLSTSLKNHVEVVVEGKEVVAYLE